MDDKEYQIMKLVEENRELKEKYIKHIFGGKFLGTIFKPNIKPEQTEEVLYVMRGLNLRTVSKANLW